jgi:hypothetical protein
MAGGTTIIQDFMKVDRLLFRGASPLRATGSRQAEDEGMG